jgi:hypothetical protein
MASGQIENAHVMVDYPKIAADFLVTQERES